MTPHDPPGSLASRGLTLLPAHEADPAAVLRFELAGREHFRRWIPDRGDGWYRPEVVAATLDDARRWWAEGTDRLHVVVTVAHGEVVARANLVDVEGGHAHLGYRVAPHAGGRGVATAAVAALLARAPGWEVHEVQAVTSAPNVASARVLRRCGFRHVGTRPEALDLDGGRLDALDWVRQLAAVPVASSR